MSKENLHTIELTDAELYAVWAIVTWFDRPVVTYKLKRKLAGMASDPERPKLEKRFDTRIEDRIIDLGNRMPRIREKIAQRQKA